MGCCWQDWPILQRFGRTDVGDLVETMGRKVYALKVCLQHELRLRGGVVCTNMQTSRTHEWECLSASPSGMCACVLLEKESVSLRVTLTMVVEKVTCLRGNPFYFIKGPNG